MKKRLTVFYSTMLAYSIFFDMQICTQQPESLMYLEKGLEQIIKNAKASNALLSDIKQELVAIKKALTEEATIGAHDDWDVNSSLTKEETTTEDFNEH